MNKPKVDRPLIGALVVLAWLGAALLLRDVVFPATLTGGKGPASPAALQQPADVPAPR